MPENSTKKPSIDKEAISTLGLQSEDVELAELSRILLTAYNAYIYTEALDRITTELYSTRSHVETLINQAFAELSGLDKEIREPAKQFLLAQVAKASSAEYPTILASIREQLTKTTKVQLTVSFDPSYDFTKKVYTSLSDFMPEAFLLEYIFTQDMPWGLNMSLDGRYLEVNLEEPVLNYIKTTHVIN